MGSVLKWSLTILNKNNVTKIAESQPKAKVKVGGTNADMFVLLGHLSEVGVII